MEGNQYDLLEVLEYIEPAELDYQDWVNVGMALQQEGSAGRQNRSPVGPLYSWRGSMAGFLPGIPAVPWTGEMRSPGMELLWIKTGWRKKNWSSRKTGILSGI